VTHLEIFEKYFKRFQTYFNRQNAQVQLETSFLRGSHTDLKGYRTFLPCLYAQRVLRHAL